MFGKSFKQYFAFSKVFVGLLLIVAIAGFPNIFAAPEYSFPGGHWVHILSHLTIGMVMASLVGWGIGCLVLLITRKSTSQPVAA